MLAPDHKGVMISFVKLLDPSKGVEYHHWHTDTHIPDVLETQGVTAAHRFIAPKKDGDPDKEFFLIYEVNDADVNAVSKRLPAVFANKQHRRLDAYAMTYGANFRRIL